MLLLNKKIYVLGGKIFSYDFKKNVTKSFCYAGETNLPDGGYDETGMVTGKSLFPSVPDFVSKIVSRDEKLETLELTDGEKEAIFHCANYACKESSRFFMSGVYFDKEEALIVATDGRRLLTASWTKFPKFSTQYFFSAKMVSLLKKKGSTISFGKNGVYVNGKNGEFIYSEKVDGQFPSYRRVIPEKSNSDKTITILDEKAFDVAEKVADKKTRMVIIEENGDVSNDGGFIASSGMIENGLGERIAFNVDFMIEAISLGCCIFYGNSPKKAWISNSVKGDIEYMTVIMPIHLD